MQFQKRKKMREYREAFDRLARRERLERRARGKALRLTKLTPIEERIIETRKALKHPHAYHEGARWLRAQTGQRDNIMKGLVAAEAFFPKMEAILGSMGVPPELSRLTLVESSFNLKANSRVGAAGVWQFMPATGKQYMIINDRLRIDERRSPLKSTVAAAKLLKLHHKILGKNWTLAIISYNHGFRGLRDFMGKKTTQSEINRIFAPCSKTAKLGFASRNYYAEFLAVLHAEAYRDLFYGEPPAPTMNPIVFKRAPHGKSAMQIAQAKGISLEEFSLLNPDIRDLRKPLPPRFRIALPGERDNWFVLTEKLSKDRSS
jgi:membrane-bound lytic murein transglycosylase D